MIEFQQISTFVQKYSPVIVPIMTFIVVFVYRPWDHWVRLRIKSYWAGGQIGTQNELILCIDVVNLGKPPITVNCMFLKSSGAMLVGSSSPNSNKYLRQNENASFHTGWSKQEKISKHKVKVITVGSSVITFWRSVGADNKKRWHVGHKDKEYRLNTFQVLKLNKELEEYVELNKPRETAGHNE